MLQDGFETLLNLEHRQTIEEIRHRYGHDTSSHAFNTLFLWKKYAGARIYLEPELFSLNYTAKGPNMWTFPCGDRERIRQFIESHSGEKDFGLCYLRQQDKSLLEELFPGKFRVEASEEDSEYLIDREMHVQLSGRKCSKLRGKIHKVMKEFSVRTEPLCRENIETAVEITKKWIGGKPGDNELHVHGNEVDQEALRRFSDLDIDGVLLYLKDEPFGVVAGFPLSEDTYDLFLAKEKELMPGLGYYLKRELICQIPEHFVYVNLEDDLGIEGLIQMKQQMLPVKMNEMWVAYYVD